MKRVMRRSVRTNFNRTKFLDEIEADALEALCKRHLGGSDWRDALLLLMGLRTGARASELLAINRNDFCFKADTVYIRGIKGSNDREIPLPLWLARDCERFVKHFQPDSKLFPICYTRLRQIWLTWRPVPKKFHSLRHTFGIRTYLHTKDIRLLQVALGHRSILNTMVYADYIYSRAEMRKIITK
jgi:integrase